jgi:hypothetical protein
MQHVQESGVDLATAVRAMLKDAEQTMEMLGTFSRALETKGGGR